MAANVKFQNLAPFLTAFVLVLLSFLFWKWVQRRNERLKEERIRYRVSTADVRKNRLKRFDACRQESEVDSSQETLPAASTAKTPITLPAEDQNIQTDESASNASRKSDEVTEEIPVKLSLALDIEEESEDCDNEVSVLKGNAAEKTDVSSTASADDLKPGSGVAKSDSKVKPENSRKWVKLTATETTEVSVPMTSPLTNLEELRSWNEGYDEFNISSTPLRRASNKLEQRPRTLVCHDMKGGYLEDRFVQGFSSSECYRIYHWQYVDIFVYFSHNFITIPPPCWTNAAHKHGVQVLGTFITEWEDGAKRCAEMFTDEYSYQTIASQLVHIAKYYNFDGWLINIENPIQPAQVNNLAEFVNYLTSEMHRCVPGSLVIWYDSVTYKGDLKWQNELNPENRIFFDVADGIFLNYGWNETNLTMSARAAGQERHYDVYVGVDVFGRGCFGGGGWNTNKATKVIKAHDLSMALFAPGWVYEKYQSSFQVSQNKFWSSIASDCTVHTLGFHLPFVTSFCQGCGDKVFKNGEVVHSNPWSHLGAQQIQPSYTNHIYSLGDQNGVLITTMEHSSLDAYNGGGCLLLSGSTKATPTSSKAVVRLYKTDLLLPSTILISFTTKLEPGNAVDVALQLHIDKKPTYIMLCPAAEKYSSDSKEKIDSLDEALLQRYGVTRSPQLSSDLLAIAVGQEHYRLFAPLSGNHHNKLQRMCGAEDENSESSWCTRHYLLAEKDLKGSRIKEIRLVLMNKTAAKSPLQDGSGSTQFQLFVGEVKIIDAVSLRRPLPVVSSLHCRENDIKVQITDDQMISLYLTLSWSYDDSNVDAWERFEIYHLAPDGLTTFLGLSFVMSFFVSDLRIPKSQKQVKFIVQAVNCAQRRRPLEDCPTITIHWTRTSELL